MADGQLVILHTNDLHGQLSSGKLARLLEARSGADVYFDSGDAVKAGNLALPLSAEPVWPRLLEAACDCSCPGNRESHILETGLTAKMRGLAHPVVCSNWFRIDGTLVFPSSLVIDRAGFRIGVVGVMVPMVTEKMKTRALSAFRWTDPTAAVRSVAAELRDEVDVLVLLSHIGHRRDLQLAVEVREFDLVLGGHSHTVVEHPVKIGRTWVCQGGSHAKYFGKYVWRPDGSLSGGLEGW